jgi:hypothetical protein
MRNQIAQTALRLARRSPVIVTGLAGIGKSWFLRSLLTAAKRGPFAEAEIHDGAHKDAAARLGERLALPDPGRLLLIDAIEALVAAEGPILDALACSRGPLILAAPPAIWELAAGSPGLQAFLAGRCRSLVLPPLSPPERRALLFPVDDGGAQISTEFAPLALDPAWGGHPRVLQQVRAILRDPTEASLRSLGDAVSARLPGHADAILASLPALDREALLAVARGEEVGERRRGAALSLVLHGALVRESDGFSMADRVLERQLGAPG